MPPTVRGPPLRAEWERNRSTAVGRQAERIGRADDRRSGPPIRAVRTTAGSLIRATRITRKGGCLNPRATHRGEWDGRGTGRPRSEDNPNESVARMIDASVHRFGGSDHGGPTDSRYANHPGWRMPPPVRVNRGERNRRGTRRPRSDDQPNESVTQMIDASVHRFGGSNRSGPTDSRDANHPEWWMPPTVRGPPLRAEWGRNRSNAVGRQAERIGRADDRRSGPTIRADRTTAGSLIRATRITRSGGCLHPRASHRGERNGRGTARPRSDDSRTNRSRR